MPRYEKEDSTVVPEPINIDLITGGIRKKKKGKKGKEVNRYQGLF